MKIRLELLRFVRLWFDSVAKRRNIGPVAVMFAVTSCVLLYADQTPLTPEEILSYRSLSEDQQFAFAPNGRSIIYTVRNIEHQVSWSAEAYAETGVPQHAIGSSIWLVDTASGRNIQISPEKMNAWAPAWSPDGQRFAYLSDGGADHKARTWIYDLITGSNHRASDLTVYGGYAPKWTPDGKGLLLETLPESDEKVDNAHAAPASHAKLVSESSVLVFVSNPADEKAERIGPWRIDEGQGGLALVKVENGHVSWVARGTTVANSWLSPDSRFVAFTTAKRFNREGSQQVLFDLSVFELQTSETRLLAKDIRMSYDGGPVTWSPDSTRIAYMEDGPEGLGEGFVVSVLSGEIRKITSFGKIAPSPYLSGGMLWDSSSEWVYFRHSGALWHARSDGRGASLLAEIRDHRLDPISEDTNQIWTADGGRTVMVNTQRLDTKACGIFRIDTATGEYKGLFEKNQLIGGRRCLATDMVVSPDRKNLAFRLQDAVHEEEIWVSDTSFHDVHQLTHANPQFERHDLGSAQLVQWQSVDGELLHGVLLLPATHQPSNKYPLLVWVYPGSSLTDQINVFGVIGDFAGTGFLHLFTTRGYAVLLPDAPLRTSEPMLDVLKNVMPGVDRIIQMGIADPDRLGVIGHSFGGYGVLALLVQTTRFKAAVVSGGYGDRMMVYGALGPDGTAYSIPIEEGNEAAGLGGTPWDLRTRFIENSPIYYLNRVNTPILLLHGVEDTAVWVPAADQLFVCLRRLGKTVEYAKYRGEEHTPLEWSHANQLDYVNRVLRWFENYLASGY